VDRSVPQSLQIEPQKAANTPLPPQAAPKVQFIDDDEADQDIFESVMHSIASNSRPRPSFQAPRSREAPIARSAPPAAASSASSSSARAPAPSEDDAIMILEDDDAQVIPSTSHNQGSSGSDWIKSMSRKKAHPNPSAGGPPDSDTSPEPPFKKIKRANSFDLVTGQEIERPPIGLSSPLGIKPAPAAFATRPVGNIPAQAAVNLAPELEQPVQPGSSRTECPVCASSLGEFENAPCGHVLCHACWKKILEKNQECPFCRQRTRMKQLRKVIMN
jgi:hypothetical protein